MLGVKKYYGLRGGSLAYAISFIAGLDFLYVQRNTLQPTSSNADSVHKDSSVTTKV
jgi:hypothetical protein